VNAQEKTKEQKDALSAQSKNAPTDGKKNQQERKRGKSGKQDASDKPSAEQVSAKANQQGSSSGKQAAAPKD